MTGTVERPIALDRSFYFIVRRENGLQEDGTDLKQLMRYAAMAAIVLPL